MRRVVDVWTWKDFTRQEYLDNLDRLNIEYHKDLVGYEVYYIKKGYGVHKVVEWDDKEGKFLLELDGQKFWSNPFKIKIP